MRVHIGADHAGFELKDRLARWMEEQGHEVIDHGPVAYDPTDDYPLYCLTTARAVVADRGSLGVVLGGSGNGEQISANKVRGVRAALAWSEQTAQLARAHNDANVVGIGARMHTPDEAVRILAAFLATPFTGEERHERRLAMISAYEDTGEIPAPPAG